MVARAVVVALAAGLFAAGSAAQETPKACTWETAVRASVRAIEKGAHYGRCVRVSGQVDARTMSATGRTGRSVAQTVEIGAYYAAGIEVDRQRAATVLARVGRCADICAENDADPSSDLVTLCMPVGWCHYHAGPFVKIEAIR